MRWKTFSNSRRLAWLPHWTQYLRSRCLSIKDWKAIQRNILSSIPFPNIWICAIFLKISLDVSQALGLKQQQFALWTKNAKSFVLNMHFENSICQLKERFYLCNLLVSDGSFHLYIYQELNNICYREDRIYRPVIIPQSKGRCTYYFYSFRWNELIFNQ